MEKHNKSTIPLLFKLLIFDLIFLQVPLLSNHYFKLGVA